MARHGGEDYGFAAAPSRNQINRGVELLSEVLDLHGHRSPRDALLRVNNASARETSLLSPERFDRMIGSASVAIFIEPGKAFLLAFAQTDDYDGVHFKWFQSRYDRFLYVDRVVVGEEHRGQGHGQTLYADLFTRAEGLGHNCIACEVNVQPPNPGSDRFHSAQGFQEVGKATIDNGAKTVRYLLWRR
jgi:predicted GNAT superfamily acetyltransferase